MVLSKLCMQTPSPMNGIEDMFKMLRTYVTKKNYYEVYVGKKNPAEIHAT